ncbi:MAG TPA: tripartite tricarboxylate transporter substrate-binding protein [Candidatus Limnocylindria bacterium]|nr:tripartite tricarboxylate transporter substrate-binding protein [Candidatus Limnocylindria bacterium]
MKNTQEGRMRTPIRAIAISAALAVIAAACGPAAGPGAGTATSAPTSGGTAAPTATADLAAFYRGKTVTIIVGYDAGGGYDTYARTLAAHIGKQIPGNPSVIVENMPGAGSIKAANHLFAAAPKDGTVFGTFGRGLPYTELIGDPAAQFKSAQFNWIGSMNDEVSICIVRPDAPVKKFDDLLTTTVKIGATGPDDDTGFFPRFLNGALGTKFQLVTGYAGGNDVNLAIERGEVQGRCGFSWSSLVSTRPQWADPKNMTILLQMSLAKHPQIPSSVPLILEYAKNDEQKQMLEVIFSRQTMGRPFAAPPGVPADRVKALRDAFDKTMQDPEFKAAAEKAKQELNPKGGQAIQDVITKIFQTPRPIVDKIKGILG